MSRDSLSSQIGHIDEQRKSVSKSELFKQLDVDGDGNISEQEFGKMFDAIQSAVAREHADKNSLAGELTRATRRYRALLVVIMALSAFLIVQLAATTGVMYALIENTKEVHAATDAPILTNNAGSGLATKAVVESTSLFDLPAAQSFSTLTFVQVPIDGVNEGFRVEGWSWYNATAMDLHLSGGNVLEITGSTLTLTTVGGTTSGRRSRRLARFGNTFVAKSVSVDGGIGGIEPPAHVLECAFNWGNSFVGK